MGKKNTVPVNPPLPLEGAWNIRELGGYPTKDGRMTRKGVFLQADGTHNLSARDVESLRERGVTLAVDLRSPEEVRRQPSRLAGQEGIRYENVSMFDRMHSALFQDDFPKSMAALYAQLLHNAGWNMPGYSAFSWKTTAYPSFIAQRARIVPVWSPCSCSSWPGCRRKPSRRIMRPAREICGSRRSASAPFMRSRAWQSRRMCSARSRRIWNRPCPSCTGNMGERRGICAPAA